MKLYQKPSEFYSELKKNPDLLGLIVSSPTQAALLLGLINKTESELSQSKSDVLITQGKSISAYVYNNFKNHILNELQFNEFQINGTTNINALSDLVENFQNVLEWITVSPDTFFENFTKDPTELDKKYEIEKLGLQHSVYVSKPYYDIKNNTYNTPMGVTYTIDLGKKLPHDIYVKELQLDANYDHKQYVPFQWNSKNSSFEQITYKDKELQIDHTINNMSMTESEVDLEKHKVGFIDKRKGLFQFLSDGSIRKCINESDHQLEYVIDDTYAIFKDGDSYFITNINNFGNNTKQIPNKNYYNTNSLKLLAKIGNAILYTQQEDNTHTKLVLVNTKSSGEIIYKDIEFKLGTNKENAYSDIDIDVVLAPENVFIVSYYQQQTGQKTYIAINTNEATKEILSINKEDGLYHDVFPLGYTGGSISIPHFKEQKKRLGIKKEKKQTASFIDISDLIINQ